MSAIRQIHTETRAARRLRFSRMTGTPVGLNDGRGPTQPLLVQHANFQLRPGEMFGRIPGRTPQWFKQTLRDQNGNIVDVKAEEPGRLFDIHARRWRGEIQKIELLLIHKRFVFQFVEFDFWFIGKPRWQPGRKLRDRIEFRQPAGVRRRYGP